MGVCLFMSEPYDNNLVSVSILLAILNVYNDQQFLYTPTIFQSVRPCPYLVLFIRLSGSVAILRWLNKNCVKKIRLTIYLLTYEFYLLIYLGVPVKCTALTASCNRLQQPALHPPTTSSSAQGWSGVHLRAASITVTCFNHKICIHYISLVDELLVSLPKPF